MGRQNNPLQCRHLSFLVHIEFGKMEGVEQRIKEKAFNEQRRIGKTLNINACKEGKLRPDLVVKIKRWMISFHRLDPRYKILKFFNQVASEGADDFVDQENDEDLEEWEKNLKDMDAFDTRESILVRLKNRLGNLFDKSSILTVWRPCSNHAMRKMMEGTGVGKGLDIKGKSAKTGLLSAYVPFLQISEENDKRKIMPIPFAARLRVYFPTEPGRQQMLKKLKEFCVDFETSEDEVTATASEQASGLLLLDEYQPTHYGIEVGQLLFWHAVVVPQDITRTDDPETDGTATGRASSPGFQDANMDTLKKATKGAAKRGNSPLPVILQYDKDRPMRPQTFIVAYEENGTVTPVVSDFDCFLLGWRREALWFGCNLPRQQEDLMMWCVDKIEEILSDCHKSADTWTVRWMEVKKRAALSGNISFDSPPYGYGDPKSYGIMEKAALRLKGTGAVRHGSECFNYAFPQEIDETFLLISDTLDKVPFRYLKVNELQDLLLTKIAEGFVFPLNPKWILCDPGWKKVYDYLMDSEALYADTCRDVWYPTSLGIRDRISSICNKYPDGFTRADGRISFVPAKGYSPLRQCLEGGAEMSGNAAFELAELELENYSRKLTLARQIQKASEELSADEDEDGDIVASMRKSQNGQNYDRHKKMEMYRKEKEKALQMQKEAEEFIQMSHSELQKKEDTNIEASTTSRLPWFSFRRKKQNTSSRKKRWDKSLRKIIKF